MFRRVAGTPSQAAQDNFPPPPQATQDTCLMEAVGRAPYAPGPEGGQRLQLDS